MDQLQHIPKNWKNKNKKYNRQRIVIFFFIKDQVDNI
jgi:hypothetical protein